MQQEVFPDSASFLNPLTRQELQHGDTCTCYGFTSSAEAMAQRAGIVIGANSQMSPYYNWYFMNKQSVSVEEAIRTANRVGYCPDELYPFNGFPLQPPGLESLKYGELHADGFAVKRINGKRELMRAICTGSTLITDRFGVAMEHVEACIGYDKIKGFLIQGSGLITDFWPWDELPKFTQLFRYTVSPFGFIPFAGYIPADPPKFDNGTLTIPLMLEYTASTISGKEVQNVVGHISDIASATWDQDLSSNEPVWKIETEELHLPMLDFYGTIYRNVIVKGVKWTYEKEEL